MSSTERGWRGTSAAGSTFRACRATATVPRACAGMHEATRRAEGRWAAPNGVEPPFRPLSAATGGPDAAEDAGEGGPACHRRQEEAKCACGAPDSRKRRRGTCQVHCERVSDADGRKMTLKSEFLNLQRNSAAQVFDRMFLASGDFSLSCFLVEWLLTAPVGCLIFGEIFGEV